MVKKRIASRLFDGLEPEELAEVLGAAQERRFAAKSVIFEQSRPADQMFVLTRGRARHFFITREGHRILFRWLVPGDIVGGRALLLNPLHYFVSAEALKDSQFLVWDRTTLHHLTSKYPTILRNVLFTADDYLRWFVTAHTALSCFTGRQRCASVLMSVAMTIGQRVEKGIEVEITNEDLADASAISLFEASRFVSSWQRSGAIVKKRGKILVPSLDVLAREIQK